MQNQIRVRVNPIHVIRHGHEEFGAGQEVLLPVDEALYLSDSGVVTLLDYIKPVIPPFITKTSSPSAVNEAKETKEEDF